MVLDAKLEKGFTFSIMRDSKKDYVDAIRTAATLNKSVKGSPSTRLSPLRCLRQQRAIQAFSSGSSSCSTNRREDADRRHVFANFLKNNPGLDHTAGCGARRHLRPRLFDTSHSVVADFSLPYRIVEPGIEGERVEPVGDGVKKPKWTVLNDFEVYLGKLDILTQVDRKLGALDERLTG